MIYRSKNLIFTIYHKIFQLQAIGCSYETEGILVNKRKQRYSWKVSGSQVCVGIIAKVYHHRTALYTHTGYLQFFQFFFVFFSYMCIFRKFCIQLMKRMQVFLDKDSRQSFIHIQTQIRLNTISTLTTKYLLIIYKYNVYIYNLYILRYTQILPEEFGFKLLCDVISPSLPVLSDIPCLIMANFHLEVYNWQPNYWKHTKFKEKSSNYIPRSFKKS